jgi:hypothetical protein
MAAYHHHLNGNKASSISSASGNPMTKGSLAQASNFYASQASNVDQYLNNAQQMPPPMQPSSGSNSFNNPQAPISPPFSSCGNQPPMRNMATTMPPSSGSNQYSGALFDPSDPALFNLDIESLNFGNHYGALEFGMLDQMSSNFSRSQGNDMNNIQMQDAFNPQYTDGSAVLFSQDALINADWQAQHPRHNSTAGLLHTPHNTPIVTTIDSNMPPGYAIGAGPGSLASASSPGSQNVDPPVAPDNANSPALFVNANNQQSGLQRSPTFAKPSLLQQSHQQPVQPPQTTSDMTPSKAAATLNPSRKRPYDADLIYETVTTPYSYTNGFHRLLGFIKSRFSREKRLRIAKALSSIRPSLITFSQQLTHRDLVFMEVSVQRKLCEYVNFINAYGTPTIIARRDGAVIAASKEFMILTGWNKNVLLGKEPNMNMNTGGSSGPTTAPGSGTASAQRTRHSSTEIDRNDLPNKDGSINSSAPTSEPTSPAHSKPVLVAELMDQDTVVEFYEDFSKLAFGDSNGHACRRGKLLKYRTKEDLISQAAAGAENLDPASITADGDTKPHNSPRARRESQNVKLENAISNEAGINKIGAKEGMVDCMLVWNVRRDIFEVPMLIVMNVSIPLLFPHFSPP